VKNQENNMAQPISEQIKHQWKENILKHSTSGLSIAAWCRQNALAVHAFYYWKDKLFPKGPTDRSSFSEITSHEIDMSNAGVILKYQGFNIQLSRDFDSPTLKRCLEILKKC
jgi:hypothetical protein